MVGKGLTWSSTLLGEASSEVLQRAEALGDDVIDRAALLRGGRLRSFERLEPPAGAAVACFGRGDDARFGRLPRWLVWDAVPSVLPVNVQLFCLWHARDVSGTIPIKQCWNH